MNADEIQRGSRARCFRAYFVFNKGFDECFTSRRFMEELCMVLLYAMSAKFCYYKIWLLNSEDNFNFY